MPETPPDALTGAIWTPNGTIRMECKVIETRFGTFMVPTGVETFLTKMERGGFELGKLNWFMKACRKYYPEPRNGTFVDVGSHIGTTIIPAFQDESVKRGVAIEANPLNAACLNASLTLSLTEGSVQVINAICHEWTGKPELLSVNKNHHGDHRVDGPADWETLAVRTVALDDVLEDAAPGWVWVDVQGHEALVLAGMTGLMTKFDFPVFMEVFPEGMKERDRLEALVQEHFEGFIDYARRGKGVQSVEAFPALVDDLFATQDVNPMVHTDVLLLT